MGRLKPVLGLALFAFVWEVVAASRLVPTDYFPTVQTIARALIELIGSRDFWMNVAATCLRLFAGFTLAVLLGLALALVCFRVKLIGRMLEPVVEILRVLPPPALAPIAIYALGLGPRMFLFLIVNAALWPIYINAGNALSGVEPLQLLTGRAYGYSRLECLILLQFPAALPQIFTGLRIAAGFALLATIAAEMLAGTDGLGYQLYEAGFSLRTPQMFALMFAIGLLGILLQLGIGLCRRAFVDWHDALAAMGQAV